MNFLKSSVLVLFVSVLVSCGGGKGAGITDPAEYNNKLMTIINETETSQTAMKDAIKSGNYAEAETARTAWVTTLDKSIADVTAVGDFKEDAALKDAALKTLNGYKAAADDYKKVIVLYANASEENPADEKIESELWDKIQNTLNDAANTLNEASDKFENSL